MIALLGCRIRAALVAETEAWNARTTRERVPDDRRMGDSRRRGRVHDGAGDLVSEGELIDRRQRAREAFWDASGGLMSGARDGIEQAIEVATRVQIDNEIMAAAVGSGLVPAGMPREQQRRCLAVIFRAAGFEVVE